MIPNLLKTIFGSRNDRLLKEYRQTVRKINALEAEIQKLSDDDLRRKTEEFKQRYSKGETLDNLLPEAFAVVRETGKRTLQMRHFDVQLIGGMGAVRARGVGKAEWLAWTVCHGGTKPNQSMKATGNSPVAF